MKKQPQTKSAQDILAAFLWWCDDLTSHITLKQKNKHWIFSFITANSQRLGLHPI